MEQSRTVFQGPLFFSICPDRALLRCPYRTGSFQSGGARCLLREQHIVLPFPKVRLWHGSGDLFQDLQWKPRNPWMFSLFSPAVWNVGKISGDCVLLQLRYHPPLYLSPDSEKCSNYSFPLNRQSRPEPVRVRAGTPYVIFHPRTTSVCR